MRRTNDRQGKGERWVWAVIHGAGVALVVGLVVVGLLWGLGLSIGVDSSPRQIPEGAQDRAYDQLPDGGLLLGDELCTALGGGCPDAGKVATEGEVKP